MRAFTRNKRGSMTIYIIGMTIAAVLVIGGVVDMMSLVGENRDVQAAADASALAAAGEIAVSGNGDDRLQAIADTMAKSNLASYKDVATKTKKLKASELQVEVSAAPRVFFPGPVGLNAKRVIKTSVATFSGSPVCMIGLDTKLKQTLYMAKQANIKAGGCAVYSNSVAKESVQIDDMAQVSAGLICSAGGVKASRKNSVTPAPLTDCPPIKDPLASRQPPTVGGCDHYKYDLAKGQTATLAPGTYCQGLKIEGAAQLQPGVYIIKNGKLDIKGSMAGDGVGFYLTGKDATLNFDRESSINLAAPKAGVMAGLLVFEDRSVSQESEIDYETLTAPKEHRIYSMDAQRLVGTIYISRNRLRVGGQSPIAAKSEYTVIVARNFVLEEGPAMILNTGYDQSDVPVPDGLGNKVTKAVRLEH